MYEIKNVYDEDDDDELIEKLLGMDNEQKVLLEEYNNYVHKLKEIMELEELMAEQEQKIEKKN